MNGLPAAPGSPGSFPLPNAGSPGTAFAQAKLHPAAIAAMTQPRQGQLNIQSPGSAVPPPMATPMAKGKAGS